MAKNQVRDIKVEKVKKKRKGVHSKCKTSHSKKSKNYKKNIEVKGKTKNLNNFKFCIFVNIIKF
tara:strand:- start:475 stop:666 length:192 start_codon:yes stop_codon:yes gene_type:complete